MSEQSTGTSTPSAAIAAPTDSANSLSTTSSQESTSSEADQLLGEGSNTSDSSSNAEAAIDQAEANGEISKSEAKALKKKVQIKVFGKTEDFEYDFNDEEGLKKTAEKAKAFDKNAKEYMTMKQQVDQLVKMLQDDPDSVLEKLGHDLNKRAEDRLQKRIEEMSKSPEQLEREKMSKELEALRKEKDESKKAREASEHEARVRQNANEIENDIKRGIAGSKTKLPANNPKVYAMIAQNMMMAIENGYNDVKVEDVIPLVERQWKEEISSYFNDIPEDLIEDLVGKPNLERMRNKRLAARPKIETAKQVKETGNKPKAEDAKPKEKVLYRDFFKKL